LPLAILPTAPVSLASDGNVFFDRYRKIPWLIRKVSVTILPSVSSLITLRSLPPGDPKRKAFAGFGDPIFSKEQLAILDAEKSERTTQLASRGARLQIRGVRTTEAGNIDNKQINSIKLEHLNRLPDTAAEIMDIANALNADLDQDVFLGKNASEHQIKTMNLSDRRVIAFATHALVPGDLDGLDQPALALSSPSVTGDSEDGLLTMGEIMKLKLNADWVVLSACNTGSSEGGGTEALTGLGRAFFYAGTRSILASMWPVETTSARKLVSDIFRNQQSDRTLSRAGALRKSMIGLIDDATLIDQATGKIIASYAHPLFWAPFVIVGEPGGKAMVSLVYGQDVKDITSGTKERATGVAKEQATVVADDASITAEVKAELSKAPHLKDAKIEVSTTGGVVTLKGKVRTYRGRRYASEIAKAVKGVKSVDNKLDVGDLVK
jgi:CHAT domain-containing protein